MQFDNPAEQFHQKQFFFAQSLKKMKNIFYCWQKKNISPRGFTGHFQCSFDSPGKISLFNPELFHSIFEKDEKNVAFPKKFFFWFLAGKFEWSSDNPAWNFSPTNRTFPAQTPEIWNTKFFPPKNFFFPQNVSHDI